MSTLQNSKLPKRQIEKMAGWQKDRLTKGQIDKIVDEMASCWNGKLMKWHAVEMASWWNGKLMKSLAYVSIDLAPIEFFKKFLIENLSSFFPSDFFAKLAG